MRICILFHLHLSGSSSNNWCTKLSYWKFFIYYRKLLLL